MTENSRDPKNRRGHAVEKDVLSAFQMPSVQTMVSRKSSITNAFVCALIPVVPPSSEQVAEALRVLRMFPTDVRCAYCGDRSTEWDHLRPLVKNRRPTGFISEIANLVPSCGKCNQSKGNKPWRHWLRSEAKLSPATRAIPDLEIREKALDEFERAFPATRVELDTLIDPAEVAEYWNRLEAIVAALRSAQDLADSLRAKIQHSIRVSSVRAAAPPKPVGH